jgi:tetratricopeptide (TPR) repeat protein
MTWTRFFVVLTASLFLAASLALAQVPPSVYDRAVADLDQQKYAEAEQILRPALAEHPRDVGALGLMGVILDAQKRFAEAETFYQRALALAPNSPSLYSNLGNHYLEQGQWESARAAYLRVTALDPANQNANSQLAQISITGNKGAEALHYLDRLPREVQATPPARLLRAQALKLTGEPSRAETLLNEVLSQSGRDPRVAYSVGMVFVTWKSYAAAEEAFSVALQSAPEDFEVLYNLGLAAQHAGHLPRALEVYRIALQQHPNEADCLFNLATIYTQTGHAAEAIVPLMQAHNAAPGRPDILLTLAQSSKDIGFYADAATALDLYLKLQPHDDVARRERGFCLINSSSLDQGLEDLRWYTQKHPKDALGLYELAIAEAAREPDKVAQLLDQALAINPKLNAARHARALLYYRKGRTEESISDLKLVLSTEPDDFRSLDALGQDYMRLERYPEAAEVLERAFKLAPKDPKILTHYGRVLTRLGQNEEAEKVMADFRALSPEEQAEEARRPYGGLFDFLSLPPEQQSVKYMESLQRNIATRPNDPALRVQLGKALLRQAKPEQAIEAFRVVPKLTADPALLATCGKVLFDYGQYAAAREFLEPAVTANPSAADLRLALAISVFHSTGAKEALRLLDETPLPQRQGDYYLLRAELLDVLGKPQDAAEALNQGIQLSPTRSDLYLQAALFLATHDQFQQMVDFLAQADRVVPNNPQLCLTRAIGLAILHQRDQAASVLIKMETQWPEWYLPYLVHGMVLSYREKAAEAKPLLETAIALGAREATAYYNLAWVIVTANPENFRDAQPAIDKALALNPKDPYVQSLAGKIAYLGKDFPAALNHLRAAVDIWPELIEAHETLSATYRALGEKGKSVEELKAVLHIKQQNPGAAQIPPFPTHELLFAVGGPSSPP